MRRNSAEKTVARNWQDPAATTTTTTFLSDSQPWRANDSGSSRTSAQSIKKAGKTSLCALRRRGGLLRTCQNSSERLDRDPCWMLHASNEGRDSCGDDGGSTTGSLV